MATDASCAPGAEGRSASSSERPLIQSTWSGARVTPRSRLLSTLHCPARLTSNWVAAGVTRNECDATFTRARAAPRLHMTFRTLTGCAGAFAHMCRSPEKCTG